MTFPDYYVYPAIISYEEQGVAVVFPDLSVATSGIDRQDAFASACELLGCVMLGLEEDGEPAPPATSLDELRVGEGEEIELVKVCMPPLRLDTEK